MRWLSVLVSCSVAAAAGVGGPKVDRAITRMPVYFEPNQGQVAGETQWITRAAGANVYITGSEVVFALTAKTRFTHNVHMKLVGASADAKAEGLEPLGGYSSYFAGKTEKDWFTGIPHFGRVRYKNVYPGIDLVYYGNQQNMEYDFLVAPGADPKQIDLVFSNVDSLRVDAGDLIVRAAGREMKQRKPRVFQAGRELGSRYRIVDGKHVRLALDAFDAEQPLTIDPILEFSTYLGGPGEDSAYGVVLDSSGFVYVAMATQSPASPTLNPFQQTNTVSMAPAVLKFTPDGKQLIYYAVLGSGGWDQPHGLTVDSSGSPILVGQTQSGRFPLKNAVQTEFKSAIWTGFIAKMTPDGRSLVYSTYFGGTYSDNAGSVVVDGSGNAYFGGQAESHDVLVKNALQPNYGGGTSDCYLAKMSATGTLLFSTYFGGSGTDVCYAVALAPDGGVVVAGSSSSTDLPFKNAIQTQVTPRSLYGTPVMAKFSADGQTIIFATLFAGPVAGDALALAIDTAGNIYVAGGVNDGNLTVKNAYQSTIPSSASAFLAKYDAGMQNLISATYLGGSGRSLAHGVGVDTNGSVYVAGEADSGDFPAKNSIQTFRGGGILNGDVFLTKFDPSGSTLVYSTLLGGTGGDGGGEMAVDPNGNVFMVGGTLSSDFPTKNAFEPVYGGSGDGFLVKISDTTTVSSPPLALSPARVLVSYVQGGAAPPSQRVTVTGPASLGFTATSSATWLSVAPGSDSGPVSLGISVNPAGLAPGNYTGTISVIPQLGTSASIEVALTVLAAAPILQSLSPSFVAEGSNDTTVTLQGSGFTPNSTVLLYQTAWTDTPVIVVNSTTLRIVMSSRYFTNAGTFPFSVQNPQSAVSNAVVLSVGIPAPQISAGGVANAASYVGNSVSPGEIVTIFGANFGSQDNTQVLFDGIAAKVIYVTPAQLSATVPYAISNSTTSLVIQSQGQRSAPVVIPVVPATPAIFTTDASGKGQGAILNQDSSINGAANPAAAGSVVVLYGTGGGTLSSDSPDRLALPVSVTIGALDAPVLYAGIAPGLLSGSIQINVQVPVGAPSGAVPVILQVGDARSRSDVTLAVQ